MVAHAMVDAEVASRAMRTPAHLVATQETPRGVRLEALMVAQ